MGAIGCIAILICSLYCRSLWRSMSRIAFFILAAVLMAFGPFPIAAYFLTHGQPVEKIAVRRDGVWCRSWGFWIPWREISWVDEANHDGGGRSHRGLYAVFDLKDGGIANHPWVPGVRLSKQTDCKIDDLDTPPDEIARVLRRSLEDSRN